MKSMFTYFINPSFKEFINTRFKRYLYMKYMCKG